MGGADVYSIHSILRFSIVLNRFCTDTSEPPIGSVYIPAPGTAWHSRQQSSIDSVRASRKVSPENATWQPSGYNPSSSSRVVTSSTAQKAHDLSQHRL